MADLVAESYDGGQYRLAGPFSPNPAKSLTLENARYRLLETSETVCCSFRRRKNTSSVVVAAGDTSEAEAVVL
jgi:hypothetical protein